MTKIAVLGAGGVGGYFGGRLARAGADVHLVARGAHLEALRRDALRVHSVAGDFEISLPVTDDPDEDRIAAVIGAQHVLGGAAFVFATIGEPGVVVHTGGPGRLVFGELDGRVSARVERLRALCEAAGIPAEASDDVRAVLWNKFAFICAQAGMTAVVRLPLADIRRASEWRMFRDILAEVCSLAAAAGTRLPEDAVERHVTFAESLEPESFSSLYHDLVHGNRMELEALHGTAVRLGRRHVVRVPRCEAVYAVLQPWAERNHRAARAEGARRAGAG